MVSVYKTLLVAIAVGLLFASALCGASKDDPKFFVVEWAFTNGPQVLSYIDQFSDALECSKDPAKTPKDQMTCIVDFNNRWHPDLTDKLAEVDEARTAFYDNCTLGGYVPNSGVHSHKDLDDIYYGDALNPRSIWNDTDVEKNLPRFLSKLEAKHLEAYRTLKISMFFVSTVELMSKPECSIDMISILISEAKVLSEDPWLKLAQVIRLEAVSPVDWKKCVRSPPPAHPNDKRLIYSVCGDYDPNEREYARSAACTACSSAKKNYLSAP